MYFQINTNTEMEHKPNTNTSNVDIVDEMFKLMASQEKVKDDAGKASIQQIKLVERIRTVVKTRPRRALTDAEMYTTLLLMQYWRCRNCEKDLTQLDHVVSTCQHKLCRDCFTAFRSLPPDESPDMCVGCKLSYLPGTF